MKHGRDKPMPAAPGRLRIIGGSLRGSSLEVPELAGLRPTSDRVRETLFNWLAPHIRNARCLDLFAGSGALGFEAASRGASSVWMIERDARVAALLRTSVRRLGADAVQVHDGDALAWLAVPTTARFEIVFVDPPFGAGLIDASLAALPPWLAPEALIYVESERGHLPVVPPDWQLHREGATRETRYALYRRAAAVRVAESPVTLAPESEAQE